MILTFGHFRKAAQRQKTATTGSTSSSRFLRTAFSSRRLTAISAMFEGLPLRAGRFAFSALGTDCSLVLISSARYLDCRNRGTRFLLRDFARGLSGRRGKHLQQQESINPPGGTLGVGAELLLRRRHTSKRSTRTPAQGSSNYRATQEETRDVFDHPPWTSRLTRRTSGPGGLSPGPIW